MLLAYQRYQQQHLNTSRSCRAKGAAVASMAAPAQAAAACIMMLVLPLLLLHLQHQRPPAVLVLSPPGSPRLSGSSACKQAARCQQPSSSRLQEVVRTQTPPATPMTAVKKTGSNSGSNSVQQGHASLSRARQWVDQGLLLMHVCSLSGSMSACLCLVIFCVTSSDCAFSQCLIAPLRPLASLWQGCTV